MAFSEEDKHVIKFLSQNKHYGEKRFLLVSWWIGYNYSQIDRTGTSKRRLPGSGHPRTARTADKIEEVETLVLSQEDLPQTHRKTNCSGSWYIHRDILCALEGVCCLYVEVARSK